MLAPVQNTSTIPPFVRDSLNRRSRRAVDVDGMCDRGRYALAPVATRSQRIFAHRASNVPGNRNSTPPSRDRQPSPRFPRRPERRTACFFCRKPEPGRFATSTRGCKRRRALVPVREVTSSVDASAADACAAAMPICRAVCARPSPMPIDSRPRHVAQCHRR